MRVAENVATPLREHLPWLPKPLREEIVDLKLEWTRRTIKTPDLHEERFAKTYIQPLQDQVSS